MTSSISPTLYIKSVVSLKSCRHFVGIYLKDMSKPWNDISNHVMPFSFFGIEILKTEETLYYNSLWVHSDHKITQGIIFGNKFFITYDGGEGVKKKHQVTLPCDKVDTR